MGPVGFFLCVLGTHLLGLKSVCANQSNPTKEGSSVDGWAFIGFFFYHHCDH